MTREIAFQAAKASFALYGGFFQDVSRRIGLEEALSLHARQGAAYGTMLAAMLNRQSCCGDPGVKALETVLVEANEEIGLETEVSRDAVSVTLIGRQCPVYDGLRSAGVDHETIGRMCTCLSEAQNAEWRKSFPQLSGTLRFRSEAGAPCIERFALGE